MKDVYEYIGRIERVHGLAGEVIIRFGDVKTVLPVSKRIFIYMYGTYVPYLIEGSRVMDRGASVKLCQITTRSQAVELQGYGVFVDKEDVVCRGGGDDGDMVGRVVIDAREGVLGKVIRVDEGFMQSFLCVGYKGEELLIPVPFIEEVNEERVIVKLPDDYIGAVLGGLVEGGKGG